MKTISKYEAYAIKALRTMGVIVPEDKAEMMKLKPENIADDGSAVCKETGAFIVPEGWNEGSIELD